MKYDWLKQKNVQYKFIGSQNKEKIICLLGYEIVYWNSISKILCNCNLLKKQKYFFSIISWCCALLIYAFISLNKKWNLLFNLN